MVTGSIISIYSSFNELLIYMVGDNQGYMHIHGYSRNVV